MDQQRVLIIDDDPSVVESVRAALSPLYRIASASDGKSALAFFKAGQADLIILDLMLDGEDGLELLPRLRALTPAPVILMTGFGTRENLLRTIRAKPDDFLDKPVDLCTLRSRVASLLRRMPFGSDPLERIRAWITRDLHLPLAATDLARSAAMGPAGFRRAFALRFGVTPKAYLEECRMMRAATLLKETAAQVKEVAAQVGYRDANNFSTAFKRFHGTSPEAFRAGPPKAPRGTPPARRAI